MKTPIILCAFTLIGCIGIITLLYAADFTILEEDVLNIEGEFHTVHVDTTMQLEGGAFKIEGEADVAGNGHARHIDHTTDLQPFS